MKTFRYRLYPTKAQQTRLDKTLGYCRRVYNQALAARRDVWNKHKESISLYDTHKLLTGWKTEQPELREANAQVLQNACVRVDLAFQAFFRRVKKGAEKPGYPKFKSWRYYDSFTFPQGPPKGGFRLTDDGKLYLSKIGDVKIVLHRPLEGKPKTLTIKRDRLGKWYACFACETEPEPLPGSPSVVGIDVGLTHFATLSTGEKIDNPRFFKQKEKVLKRARSQRDEALKGSARRKQLSRRANHIEQHITNRRADFAHKLSRQLVDEYQVIVFEDLNVQGMMNGNWRSMNRSIADVAWSQFITFTEQKAKAAGRTVIKVPPRGTTQRCSRCGKIVKKDLSVRVHDCPFCGLVLDRDHNAALNILARGLACVGSIPRSSLLWRGEQSHHGALPVRDR